jgi:hypothetical protein
VNLRNLVPNWLDDGPTPGADGPNEVSEARAYHNFLPMITDGFNINQIRMSSTVGLSAQRVAQLPTRADGSNVGLNGAVVAAAPDSNLPGSPFDLSCQFVSQTGIAGTALQRISHAGRRQRDAMQAAHGMECHRLQI